MKKKILVVTDEESIGKLLNDFLSVKGYEVSICENGKTALSKIQAGFTPDLVMTDFMMLGMNGLELTKKIKASMPVPVVIMTSTPEFLVAVGENPADAVINKPFFKLKNLPRIVNELIG